MSIQRHSKWQQHPKKVREVEAYEGRKEFWDSLNIPKQRIIQAEPNHPHKKKKGRTPTILKITAYREADIRDGRRCQHPGCYKTNTDHHHIVYRSAGGKNHVENLVNLCSEHHAIGKKSPHQSVAWRRFWEGWAEERYPTYWQEIREGQQIATRQQLNIGGR